MAKPVIPRITQNNRRTEASEMSFLRSVIRTTHYDENSNEYIKK